MGAGVERGGRSLSTTVPDKVHKRCVDNSLPTVTYHPHNVGSGLHFLSRSRRERKGTCLDSAIRSHTNHVACLCSNPTKTGSAQVIVMYVLLSISTYRVHEPCRIQSKVELSEQNCSWFEGARTVLGALSRNTANQPKARHEARIFSPS